METVEQRLSWHHPKDKKKKGQLTSVDDIELVAQVYKTCDNLQVQGQSIARENETE